jgi:hypothetical protein
MCTTGYITNKNYSKSKAGEIGFEHHSYGFVVVELKDDETCYIPRNVKVKSDGSFIDIVYSVNKEAVAKVDSIPGFVFGDIHNDVIDEEFYQISKDLVCNQLKPEKIILHDLLDGYSLNPHEEKDMFIKRQKIVEGKHLIDKEIERLGGTTAGIHNSVSCGPNGRGIVHYYYDDNGNRTDTYWEQHQTGGNEDLKYHGLYSGPGSITENGFPKSENYNFEEQPIDWADAIAKRHDMDYAAVAGKNYAGYLEDVRTVQADRDMVARIDDLYKKNWYKIPGMKLNGPEGVDTPFRETTSTEMESSSVGQRILINALAIYKQWKIDNNLGNDDKYKDNREAFKKEHSVITKILDQLPED